MKDPCTNCLVAPCCSKRCRDYALYILKTGEYKLAGDTVVRTIEDMPFEEAIQHILNVENTYLQFFGLKNWGQIE
jgi:hypothetical protein